MESEIYFIVEDHEGAKNRLPILILMSYIYGGGQKLLWRVGLFREPARWA